MVKHCAIKGCKNYEHRYPNISLHFFPKNADLRQKWLDAIPTNLLLSTRTKIVICSAHFMPDSFQPKSMGLIRRILKKTAVPVIFDCSTIVENKEINQTLMETNGTGMIKEENSTFEQCLEVKYTPNTDTLICSIQKHENEERTSTAKNEIGIQTNLINTKDAEVQTFSKCYEEILALRRKNRILMKRLDRRDRRIKSMRLFMKYLKDLL